MSDDASSDEDAGRAASTRAKQSTPVAASTGEAPDCLTCSACCRTDVEGLIAVYEADVVRWLDRGRNDLVASLGPGRFGGVAFKTTKQGACVHLGTAESPHACGIYDERGETCRGFPAGCARCHQFRQEAGIEG